MTEAVLILAGIVTVLGCALYFLTRAASDNTTDQVIEKINALLPQTQCGQCNYPGCRPYAEAIATQNVPINQCPPGGTATIEQLAQLLGQNTLPLNADNGTESQPLVAWIHEDLCIGCKKCILACPVDAIMGAAKKMHTVIAAECTGCELCLEPCPVDCIDMIEISETLNSWRQARPQAASCGF